MREIFNINSNNRIRNQIFCLIFDKKKISKQEIAAQLKLSLPTVTQYLQSLKDEGLIDYGGTFESTGGRKAKIIQCVENAFFALGLDITRNHLSLVLVNMRGNICFSKRIKLSFQNNAEYFSTVGATIDRFITDNNIDCNKILGVALTLPAIIASDKKTVTYATVIDTDSSFYRKIGQYIKLPFKIYNDANAAAFAEYWVHNDIETMAYLSLSNSVGGSFILDGRQYTGYNERAGEFGHMTIVPDGKTCYCGKKGCVDAYCCAKVLSDHADGNLPNFFEAVKNNDPKCRKVFTDYLNYLALAINSLRMIFDCDVVMGGYVGPYLLDYMDEIKALVASRNTFENNADYIKPCKFTFEASAVGGAMYYLSEFMHNI